MVSGGGGDDDGGGRGGDGGGGGEGEERSERSLGAQSRRAPARTHQILRACGVDIHFEDFEANECTVNSIELAGLADTPLQSNPGLNRYRKNP